MYVVRYYYNYVYLITNILELKTTSWERIVVLDKSPKYEYTKV